MNFTIKSILLWPKDESKDIRTINFEKNKVNIITGGSEKGKSSIISIIDYCFGSSECKIPTRTIRDKTEWFGVLISLENDDEILLARKEPGMSKVSGDMYMKSGKDLHIPDKIVSNCNYNDVKHRLNDLAKLPYINLDKGEYATGFQSRPSFRDMVAFVFQPQYIVANQSSLYYKSDSSKHREKLKNIFPYILKAVDNEYLELKEELRDRERELNASEKELEKRIKLSEKWLGSIRSTFMMAKEFGLLNSAPYPSDDWKPKDYIPYFRVILKSMDDNSTPLIPEGATSITTKRIVELQEEEIKFAFKLQNLRGRQELIKKIEASNRGYRDTLLDQMQRLDTVSWFNKKIAQKTICPFCESETTKAKNYIEKLVTVNSQILEKGYSTNDHHTVLNDELEKLTKEILTEEKNINNIREELRNLQSRNVADGKKIQTINNIYKFIGQLEVELKNYDAQLDNSDIIIKINLIKERINFINEKIKQDIVSNKVRNAKVKVTTAIKHFAKIFNAANSDEIIELNIKDLTLNFISKNGRFEALYEIGSGSNYMAYHLSTLLGLHEFFLRQNTHPVPNFIIFDQPSQAYFPDTDVEFSRENEDIIRVKKIFKAFESAINRTNGKLQIIVLEHVGKFAWDSFENMHLVKRWREDEEDNALIPRDWL